MDMRRSLPWQSCITLGLATSAAASLVISLVIAVHPFAEVRWGFHVPLRFCGQLFDSAEFRGVVASALVLSVIAMHVALAARAWRRSAQRVEQLTRVLASTPQTRPTRRVNRVLRETGTVGHVSVVDSSESFVFTTGLKNPRIYLSQRVVDSLDDDELRAVLLHENQHRLARDPLRMQFLLALRAATPYLPATRRLVRACLRQAEYDADDAALLRAGNISALLRAFAKMSPSASLAAAVARYTDFASVRIARLSSGQQRSARSELPGVLNSVVISLVILAVPPLFSLALTEIHSFSAFHP